jgi:hypothetical protein
MTALARPLALAVLAAQLGSAGIASIAHSREAVDVPVRIESTRHEQCPTVHNPAVCAICSHAHTQALGSTPTVAVTARRPARVMLPSASRPPHARPMLVSSAPRGPPIQPL